MIASCAASKMLVRTSCCVKISTIWARMTRWRALAQLTREGVLEHVGYGLYARRPKDAEPVLRLEDFGQLARIAWSRKPRSAIAAREALALYERNWRFVEPAAMQRQEKALLKYLVCTYGGGVLHV